MSRFFHITLFIVITFLNYSAGQSDASSIGSLGNDIFFLDLGIVIEPSTGHEEVNRLVKAPPEKVKFFVDKAPSGSVFIATTKELQETLHRINDRIEILEHAFQEEFGNLKEENKELRDMIADLLTKEPILPPQAFAPAPSLEGYSESVSEPSKTQEMESMAPPKEEGGLTHEVTSGNLEDVPEVRYSLESAKEKGIFNRMLYMNAVFAYQREDYSTALRHFSKLSLGSIDQITAGNVLYWIADSYYQLGIYREALKVMEVIKPLFSSDRQDDAMVLTGLVYRQMGNETQAIQAFINIVDEYPDSEYLKLAQMELRKIER